MVIRNLKTKTFSLACMTAMVLLSSNKREVGSQIYADEIAKMDGIQEICGDTLHVEDLKNKMLIINFWASYDAQSRMNSYQLIQTLEAYKDASFHNGEGIDVLSISLDKFKSPLKKAIQTDGTSSFHHICDYKGADSDLAKLFEVYKPVNMLIDADGTVIARDFNVETIKSTLEMLAIQ
ncbi:MAG: TlpA family protein disulfide reductase [Bacteroidales bacterium]|nr:TlpA family protein disulfide reductase [Bacteroidales bacterium]